MHGLTVQNCLVSEEEVMACVAHSAPIFSMTSEHQGVIGTLALKTSEAFFFHGVAFANYHFESNDEQPNRPPLPTLEKAIAEFIAELNRSCNVEWLPFVHACKAWREKAGMPH